MKQNDKNKNLHIIEGLIAIILLAGIVWFLTNGHQATAPSPSEPLTQNTETNPTNPTNPTIPTKEPATNTPSGKNVIVVSTQIKGTKTVTIDNATLSKPGFIVITPAENGKVVLGASNLLSAGTKQDLEILLSKTMTANSTYVAQIYQDDGDKVFNITKDKSLAAITSPAIGYITFQAK